MLTTLVRCLALWTGPADWGGPTWLGTMPFEESVPAQNTVPNDIVLVCLSPGIPSRPVPDMLPFLPHLRGR